MSPANHLRAFLGDEPIASQEDDLLERSPLAAQLAGRLALHAGDASLAVGICGPWGSGKTSFVNLLLKELHNATRPRGHVLTVAVSPWTLSSSDDIARDLLNEIAATLDRQDHINALESKAIGEVIRRVSQASEPGVMPLTLRERQDAVSTALRSTDDLLVVALDDIERLPRDRIQGVFRLVGSLGRFANTVFVLALDRDRAADAISGTFADGYAFLEKFLSVTLDLPTPDPDRLRATLIETLNHRLSNADFPADMRLMERFTEIWHIGGLRDLIRTPRDVVRITNAFELAIDNIGDDTHPVDLLALESLRCIEPAVHGALEWNRHALIFTRATDRYVQTESDRQRDKAAGLAAILGKATPSNERAVRQLVHTLFPFSQPSARVHSPSQRAHRQRLAESPEHFGNYFRWRVASGTYGEKALRHALEAACGIRDDSDAEAWRDKHKDRFQILGEKLANYMETLGPARMRWDFAAGILRVAHLLDDGHISLFSLRSPSMLATSLAHAAVALGDQETQDEWASAILSRTRGTQLLYGVLRFFAARIEEADTRITALPAPSQSVRNALAERVADAARHGAYDEFQQAGALMCRWRDLRADTTPGPTQLLTEQLREGRTRLVDAVLRNLVRVSGASSRWDASNASVLASLFELAELHTYLQGANGLDDDLADATRRAIAQTAPTD